jgi:hypothetical protein
MATEYELGSDNIRDTHWIGQVVDNKDPLNNGRCKVNVFGKFDILPIEAIPWASPANSMGAGQHFVPRKGDIVAITFDNGNIYLPIYSCQINQNLELKNEVLAGSAEPENTIALAYDALRNFRFYVSKEDGLVLTTGEGKSSAPMLRFHDGKIFLNSDNIFIASNWNDESEPAVKGETLRKILDRFMQSVITHKHLTPNGSPTSAPIPPEVINISSDKSKLESIKQFKSKAAPSTSSSSGQSSGGAPTTVSGNASNNSSKTSSPVAPSTNPQKGQPEKPTSSNKSTGSVIADANSTQSSSTYSTTDELILNENDAPVSYTGVTTDAEAASDDDGGKFNGNDNSTSFYNGNASDKAKNSIIKAVQATHAFGGSNGKCARYTYNTARNYVQGLSGKQMTKGANFNAGGNANGIGYIQALKNLGYDLVAGGKEMSKSEIQTLLSRDFDIGDVVSYWAVDGPSTEVSKIYGHTQMFTGGLHTGSDGHKWITDHITNYRTYFAYASKPATKWNLLIFKAPVS